LRNQFIPPHRIILPHRRDRRTPCRPSKTKSTAYKIGYCKSHRPTQFSKGRSSNPGGRHVVLLPSRGETAISLFGAKNSLFSAELSRFGAEQGILRNSLMLHREKVTPGSKQPPTGRKIRQFPVKFPVLSSPPGFGRTYRARNFCYSAAASAAPKVGNPLVRLSPFLSWTRGSWSTSDCRHGPSSVPEHAC